MLSLHGEEVNVIKDGLSDPEHSHIKRHAEVEINGKLTIGDVVFTETIKEYYQDKRHLDSRLNRCILHVAARDEFTNLRVRLNNGKSVPTVIGWNI